MALLVLPEMGELDQQVMAPMVVRAEMVARVGMIMVGKEMDKMGQTDKMG